MRSIFIITIILFLLTACVAPTVTATIPPTIALTLPPSFTATPTFSPEQVEQVKAVDEIITGWGVDASEWNYSYNTETGELGIYLAKNAFLSMEGEVKLTLADGIVVDLKSTDVTFDEQSELKIAGYNFDEKTGEWVSAVDPILGTEAGQTATEFKIAACTAEHIFDQKIEVEDIPAYYEWLKTLSKPFDESKIKDVPLMRQRGEGNRIIYDWTTAPNWEDLETTGQIAPFRRDVTCAYLEYQGWPYALFATEYFVPNGPSQWVMTVASGFWPGHTPEESKEKLIPNFLELWVNKMNITPIVTNDQFQDARGHIQDPLVARVFAAHPDLLPDGSLNPDGMEARFSRFIEGDMSALSGEDIYLLTQVGDSSNHWFE